MSREQSAHDAVQRLIPDDTILDVALMYPRGFTRAQAVGAAAGGLLGSGSDFVGVGLALGTVAGGKLFGSLKEVPSSIVLAVSDSAVYTLGRDRMGLVGGWDTLVKMVKFDRRALRVHVRSGVTIEVTLTDTEHDVSLELEAKRLGNLGVKALVSRLSASS
jgi:hypothetical protein